MSEQMQFQVNQEQAGMRIDKFLSDMISGYSREKLKVLFSEGKIRINYIIAKPSVKIKIGDIIEAEVPDAELLEVCAQDIPLNIVYEDQDLAIIDKPQGMVVHPAPGNYENTMVNALLFHLSDLSAINGVIRPGIVHRIDKDTSGLLVVAKNDYAHNKLAEQFAGHTITRAYTAIVHGSMQYDKGTIDAPIGRHHINRKEMTVTDQNSKHAVTHYSVAKRYAEYTHIDVHLETGRTHQIRVHMKYIGHPIIGDPIYGRSGKLDQLFDGQLLHAYLLGFQHPTQNRHMTFQSPIPEYFFELIEHADFPGRMMKPRPDNHMESI